MPSTAAEQPLCTKINLLAWLLQLTKNTSHRLVHFGDTLPYHDGVSNDSLPEYYLGAPLLDFYFSDT